MKRPLRGLTDTDKGPHSGPIKRPLRGLPLGISGLIRNDEMIDLFSLKNGKYSAWPNSLKLHELASDFYCWIDFDKKFNSIFISGGNERKLTLRTENEFGNHKVISYGYESLFR